MTADVILRALDFLMVGRDPAAAGPPNPTKEPLRTASRASLILILPAVILLLLSSSVTAGDLVITSGEPEWVGDDAEGPTNPVAGEALPDSGEIGSTTGATVLQGGPDLMILLDQGTAIRWGQGRNGLLVRPQSGRVVIQANRTSVESTGIEVVFGGRRFWIAEGTAVFEVEEGLLISVLLRGRQFDLDASGTLLMATSSPSVTMEAGGTAVVFDSVSDLVRSDQVRIYGPAVWATEVLAEQLRLERDGIGSIDLGAVLESLRRLRFHLPAEKRLEINMVLIAAARREWALQRSRPVAWPPILPIPEMAVPWDEALGRD